MHAISTETVFDGNRIVFNCTSSNQGRKHQEARDSRYRLRGTSARPPGTTIDYLNKMPRYAVHDNEGARQNMYVPERRR